MHPNTSIEKPKKNLSEIRRKAAEASALVRQESAKAKHKTELQVAKQVKKIQLKQATFVAQQMILPAVGLTHVYKRITHKNDRGTVTRVENIRMEDPDEIAHALNCIDNNHGIDDDETIYYYITTKDPDYRAGEAILNRAIGKTPDKIEANVKHTFTLTGLAKSRKALPEHEPIPTEARIIDHVDDSATPTS